MTDYLETNTAHVVNHILFLVKVVNVPQHAFCYILITEADIDFLFISLHSTV